MSRARKTTLPKGNNPVGEKTDLSNVVFVSWTQPNRQVIERPVSMVVFVDFQTRKKIGHVVTIMDGRAA